MNYLNSQESIAIRQQPHRTKLYLSIYQPPTVLACQINDGAIAKGDRVIAYDSVSVGSYLAVESGMTMYVGTETGLSDKGTIRIKSIGASSITVAENSHIDWEDDDYLTIVRFWEIRAIYPRIIQNPADELDTIWYKDYDIAYTNQNDILGSFICMGPHHAGFLDGGEHQVYYTATGTSNLRNQAMSYEWHFQGGTPTGSSSAVPGLITYDTPGHYTTTLTVTTGDGCEDISYRHISIYDRPNQGTFVPFLNWQLEDFSGDIQQNGYATRIQIRDTVDTSNIRDGALVVIFSENWYDETKQSIGGNAINRESIFFVGYIQAGTIQWNYRDGYVIFDAVSPSEIMKSQEGFAVSVQDSSDPSASAATNENIPSGWVVVLNMTTKRAIYHYLRWHSTALLCNDFQYTANERAIQYFDANRDSMYSAVEKLMNSALVGMFACDRQGKLWASQELDSINNALSFSPPTNTSLFHITNNDWLGDPIITERQFPDVSYLEMGGVTYAGMVTGTFSANLASAPGLTPGYGGNIQRIQGLALGGQTELNTLVGNVYAQKNSRYPSIAIDMVSNYSNFDIAPRQFVTLTLAADDTPRGITFNQKYFSPFSVIWTYNPETETLLPSVLLREVTEGISGDTIPIPDVPPVDTGDGGGGGSVDEPPIVVPPLPPPILPPLIGKIDYFAARFQETVLSAAVESALLLDFVSTNVGGVGGTYIVTDTNTVGGVWLSSINIYARNDISPFDAFTLNLRLTPCPGYIFGPDFDNTPIDVASTLPGATYEYITINSYSANGIQYAHYSLTYPVFAVAGLSTSLAGVTVTSDVDVIIVAAATGIRLTTNIDYDSACKLVGGG